MYRDNDNGLRKIAHCFDYNNLSKVKQGIQIRGKFNPELAKRYRDAALKNGIIIGETPKSPKGTLREESTPTPPEEGNLSRIRMSRNQVCKLGSSEAKLSVNIINGKNMQEIVNINISEIVDFPTQREIYGEPIIEAEFLASVKEFGVITPVIVSKGSDCYILISGHRRKEAAKLAELSTVPAIIREYDSTEEMQLEFLSCNMQREKTPRVRINEFLRYKQLLCQIGKVRKKSRNYENTIFENKMFSRILDENIKDSSIGEFSIDSTEILKQVTGYSEYEQTYLSVLYDDDWLQRKLDKLRLLGCSAGVEEQLISLREKAVQEYEAGNATLNNAVSEVKKVFKDAEAHLKPKEEKKPPLTPPKEVNKKPQVMKLALQLPGVKATCRYSETPLQYDEEKSVCEFFFKSSGLAFGFITTLDRPVGICCETPNGIVMLNPERLAELVRKEVGIKE